MKNITLSALLISSLFCVTVQAMNEKEKKENRGITIQSSHIEYESDKKNTLLTDEQIAKLTEELAGLRFVKMEAEKIEAETKDELAQLTLTREKIKKFHSYDWEAHQKWCETVFCKPSSNYRVIPWEENNFSAPTDSLVEAYIARNTLPPN